jgi:hypothetical protein
MSYETFYTASVRYDGDASNPWYIPSHVKTRASLIRHVRELFNFSGVRCRHVDGVGPDGLSYIILYPKQLKGFEIIGKEISILIEERLTEDGYIG